MPIYAYRCAACGHTKDVLRKMSDAPLADCPACGASDILRGAPRFEKQVTAAGGLRKSVAYQPEPFNWKPAAAPKAGADGPKAEGGEATKTPVEAAGPAAPAVPAAPAPAAAAALAAPAAKP